MKVGQFEILDTAGWEIEKSLPDYDYHYGQDKVIPSNFTAELKLDMNMMEKLIQLNAIENPWLLLLLPLGKACPLRPSIIMAALK